MTLTSHRPLGLSCPRAASASPTRTSPTSTPGLKSARASRWRCRFGTRQPLARHRLVSPGIRASTGRARTCHQLQTCRQRDEASDDGGDAAAGRDFGRVGPEPPMRSVRLGSPRRRIIAGDQGRETKNDQRRRREEPRQEAPKRIVEGDAAHHTAPRSISKPETRGSRSRLPGSRGRQLSFLCRKRLELVQIRRRH